MRCDSINIQIKIPVPINSDGTDVCKIPCFKDANGDVYEIEAIKFACEEAKSLPIIRYDNDGKTIVIGIAESINYKDGYIKVNGIIFGGGTSETTIFSSTKDIIRMDIESVDLGV